jgi:hypothetical protein
MGVIPQTLLSSGYKFLREESNGFKNEADTLQISDLIEQTKDRRQLNIKYSNYMD